MQKVKMLQRICAEKPRVSGRCILDSDEMVCFESCDGYNIVCPRYDPVDRNVERLNHQMRYFEIHGDL